MHCYKPLDFCITFAFQSEHWDLKWVNKVGSHYKRVQIHNDSISAIYNKKSKGCDIKVCKTNVWQWALKTSGRSCICGLAKSVYRFGDVLLRWFRGKLKSSDRFLDQIPRQYEFLEELVRIVLVDFLSVPRGSEMAPFLIAGSGWVVRTGPAGT